MIRVSLRITEELHERIRWVAYKEKRSQHAVIVDLLEKALKNVDVPQEVRE